jgi:hypothetical protein
VGQSVPPDSRADPEPADTSKADAANWRQGITSSSRRPLIPDAVRATIDGAYELLDELAAKLQALIPQ